MKTTTKITLASSTILLFLLLTTDPQKMPSILLIAPFILLFTAVASGVPAILGSYGLTGQRFTKAGLTVAVVLVLLLVLQSLGQLTIRDTLAAALLLGIAHFYVSRFGLRSTG